MIVAGEHGLGWVVAVDLLEGLQVGELGGRELVARIAAGQALVARVQAQQLELMAALSVPGVAGPAAKLAKYSKGELRSRRRRGREDAPPGPDPAAGRPDPTLPEEDDPATTAARGSVGGEVELWPGSPGAGDGDGVENLSTATVVDERAATGAHATDDAATTDAEAGHGGGAAGAPVAMTAEVPGSADSDSDSDSDSGAGAGAGAAVDVDVDVDVERDSDADRESPGPMENVDVDVDG
ncbi:hypothetical protein GIS00_26645, partial [Nakamurella sp. YIM 132087]